MKKKSAHRIFGLIGTPLSHSFSKKYFTEKFLSENIFDASYENFQIDSLNKLTEIINQYPTLSGLNVTIPYKKEIIKLLDYIDPEAKEIGAVNTIKIIRGEEKINLYGYNTDSFGFKKSLDYLPKNYSKGALILGTGGASAAVAFVLKKLNIPYYKISRNPNKEKNIILYKDISSDLIQSYPFIINTSPVGMFPDMNDCPDIPYSLINATTIAYDLIYNPEETLFLKKCREQGAFTFNGLAMLKLQADKAWEIWSGN